MNDKTSKKENEESLRFLMMKDKKHEDTLRQVIDNQYDNILKTFIDSTLKTKNLDIYNKWASIIKDVVKLCISKLNPSFRFNGDSLLITDYIKIKTILHTDRTLTRVISGFALQKNVCSKKMPTLLDTPKLLIMNCQVEQPDDMFINSIHNDKTNQNINILQKQIEAVDPDLILFNKSIPHKLQECLIAKKPRAIVLNVKDKSLLNIARCTKTYALSSVSQLNKHMKLGECGKFRIDKYQNLKHNNFNLSPIKNDIIKTHEYYLMLFEGCEPTLFSTILLFGPNYEELRILKHLLNNVILLTARDFYLQKYFLYFSYIDIHQPYSFNNNNNNVNSPVDAFQITSTSSSSGKNVTTSINNGRISSYKKPKSSNAILPLTASSSVSTALPLGSAGALNKQWMPFDEQSIEYGQSCLWFVKLTLVSNKNNVFFGGNNNVTQDTSDISVGDVQSRNNNESEVLKKINYMCAYPENVKLMFYAKEDKDDKPLGKLIIDLCYKGRDKCDTCKRLNNNHIYIMYSTNGKLIMSFIQNKKENHLDKVLDFLNIIDTSEPPSSQDQPQQGSTDTNNNCKCKCNEHNTLCNNNTNNINLPLNTTPTTQNTVAPPPVTTFTTSSQVLLVNKFYGVNIKFPDNKINYNIDIYSYGYCRICCCIVTPLVKLPKELWNYSSTKYFKHFLFGNDLRNRNDKKESNLSWIYINKEYNDISCAHSAFHDIDRLFITQFGTIKLSYNKYTKYKMDYGLFNIKRGEHHMSLLTTLDNSISFSKHKTQKVLKYLMKNYNVARCEAKNLLDEIRLNNNIHTKHNISKILSTLIEWVNKYIIALQEFEMFIEYVFVVPAKFPTYVKLHVYVAKIYLKLVQFKLIDNNFREILRKVKNLFSLINTVSSPNFKINSGGGGDTGGDGNNGSGNKNKTGGTNNNSNNNVGNNKNNNIFLNDNLSPTPTQPPLQSKSPIVASSSTTIKHDIFIPLLNPVDNNNNTATATTEHQSIILNGNDDSARMIKKSQTFVLALNNTTINNNNNYQCSSSFAFPKSEYIDLEYKDKYRYVLDYLAYYDEYHTEHTTHFNECDISSIIAYALTSDKYIQFMTAKDKFKLTSVRCERKLVKTDEHKQQTTNSSQFSNSNTFFQKIFSKDEDSNYQCFKTLNQSDVYNYFPIKNKSSLCDTSLLFDISRNTYYNVTIDKKDIAQELETQLLSTNTEHFVYEVKNFNMKRSHTLNVDFNYTNTNQRSTEFIKANVFQNKDTSKDDNTQQQQQPQSQATTPTAATNTNITFTTQQQHQQQQLYKVITSTECNSFSSTVIKKTIDDLQCMKEELKQEKHNILTEHNINTSSPESKSKFEYSKLHKHTFIENETYSKTCEITVYYPRQFEALRIIYCATYNEFILSIAKSLSWQNVSGGKSKADFYKSIDNKYILKCLDKQEFNMFIKSAFQYFLHMNSYLFHKMPSALAKILGAFKIKIKYNLHSNMQSHYYYVVLMENALYNVDTEKSYIKVYDLKGSNINRYVPKSQIVPGKVQLDTNYKENSCGEPLVLDRSMMELLVAAVHNDSLMLNTINVIDYSLLVIVNEMERTIRFKLIDYIRKYTLDKQLEHVAKIIINGLNSPTIIGPNQYMERLMKALNEYFIGI